MITVIGNEEMSFKVFQTLSKKSHELGNGKELGPNNGDYLMYQIRVSVVGLISLGSVRFFFFKKTTIPTQM